MIILHEKFFYFLRRKAAALVLPRTAFRPHLRCFRVGLVREPLFVILLGPSQWGVTTLGEIALGRPLKINYLIGLSVRMNARNPALPL